MRHYELALSDDPTDKSREFGTTGDNLAIHFSMEGTTAFFNSPVPTRWEMDNCRVVEMTDDNPWNSSEVNTSQARSSLSLEMATFPQVCALDGILIKNGCGIHNNKCGCLDSNLSVFEFTIQLRHHTQSSYPLVEVLLLVVVLFVVYVRKPLQNIQLTFL
jgi:hypothetical protein